LNVAQVRRQRIWATYRLTTARHALLGIAAHSAAAPAIVGIGEFVDTGSAALIRGIPKTRMRALTIGAGLPLIANVIASAAIVIVGQNIGARTIAKVRLECGA
jgi:hypothetical protein